MLAPLLTAVWAILPLSLFCLWPFCCAQFSGHISCAFDGLVNVGRAHKHTHTHTPTCLRTHTHIQAEARRHYTLINCSDCTSIAFSLPFRFLCLLLLPLLLLLLLLLLPVCEANKTFKIFLSACVLLFAHARVCVCPYMHAYTHTHTCISCGCVIWHISYEKLACFGGHMRNFWPSALKDAVRRYRRTVVEGRLKSVCKI